MKRIKRLDDMAERLLEIQTLASAGDDEAAHSKEADLYRDVLFTIAHANTYEDKRDLKDMARQALLTQNMEFERNYA